MLALSQVAQHPLFAAAWDGLMLAVRYELEFISEKLAILEEIILSQAPGLNVEVYHDVLITLILRSSRISLTEQGYLYHWTYGEVENLRRLLVEGLVNYIERQETGQIQTFAKIAAKLTTLHTSHPFVGCSYCPYPCIFRFEARRLTLTEDFQRDYGRITATSSNLKDAILNLAKVTFQEHLGAFSDDLLQGGAYCTVVQMLAGRGSNHTQQKKAAAVFAKSLFAN